MTGRDRQGTIVFLLFEAVLYGAVVIPGFRGDVCHPLRFLTVLVCAVWSLCGTWHVRDRNHILLSTALCLTALADFCFEILLDWVLPAIVIFVLVQLVHGERLQFCSGVFRKDRKGFLFLRIFFPLVLLLSAGSFLVAGPGIDSFSRMGGEDYLLPAMMLVYGVNILVNQFYSLLFWHRARTGESLCMMLGFFLFILCDITVAANLLYPDTGLSLELTSDMAKLTWVFYIPSQVLFAISVKI